MNVGASRPEDAGLYFSWGNIVGVSADDAAAVAAMTEAAYANTPGASINRDLSFDTEDAAIAIMGENWCMPDDEDLQELFDECDWEWTSVNGVNGYLIKSKAAGNNNSIFLPAAGKIDDGSLSSINIAGLYWSSSYNDSDSAYYAYFNDAAISPVDTENRYYGFCIRARLA